MLQGLKITTQDNSTFYNLTLIARVDYNEDNHLEYQENTTNDNSDNKTNKHNKMHPNNIPGLAQENPKCLLTNKDNIEANKLIEEENNQVKEEILVEIQEREEDEEEDYKEPFDCQINM
jgi:hypothetical protein